MYSIPLLTKMEYKREGRLRYCYERSLNQNSSRKDDESPALVFQMQNITKSTTFIALVFCINAEDQALHKNIIMGEIAKDDSGFGIFELKVEPALSKTFHLTRSCAEIRVVPTKENSCKNDSKSGSRHSPRDDPPSVRFKKRTEYLESLKRLFPNLLDDIHDSNDANKGRSSSCRLALKLIDLGSGNVLNAFSHAKIRSCYKAFRADSARVQVESGAAFLQLTLKWDDQNASKDNIKLIMSFKSGREEETISGHTDDFDPARKTIWATFDSKLLCATIQSYLAGDKSVDFDTFQISLKCTSGTSDEEAHTPIYVVKSIDKHANIVFEDKAPEAPKESQKVDKNNAKSLEELKTLLFGTQKDLSQSVSLEHQAYFQPYPLCVPVEDEDRRQETEIDVRYRPMDADLYGIDHSDNFVIPYNDKMPGEERQKFENSTELVEKTVVGRGAEVIMDGFAPNEADCDFFGDLVQSNREVPLEEIPIDDTIELFQVPNYCEPSQHVLQPTAPGAMYAYDFQDDWLQMDLC